MSVHRTDGTGSSPRSEQLREAQQQQNARRTGEHGRQQGDRLDISPQAREAERLRKLAEEVPEIREDRVARARSRDGRVDADRLARLLLDADER